MREAILYRGDLPRGDVAGLFASSERTARGLTSSLVERGVLTSASTRAPLQLAFPAALASRWMRGLFSDKPASERQRASSRRAVPGTGHRESRPEQADRTD